MESLGLDITHHMLMLRKVSTSPSRLNFVVRRNTPSLGMTFFFYITLPTVKCRSGWRVKTVGLACSEANDLDSQLEEILR